MKKFIFRNGVIEFDKTPVIMGILNVTPDSFSDGGEFFIAEKATDHAISMKNDGADIIDIGAVSTRPGSSSVSVSEEICRLAPVLRNLVKTDIIISVDTFNPGTAEFALENGAHIINDVSGVFNPAMADVIKRYGAGWVMTHTCNVPSGESVEYPDGVVNAVKDFFDSFVADCKKYGIAKERICLDAGFGFAKNTKDNVELLKNLEKVIRPDVAFMTALSRKRFIGELTETENPSDRVVGTVVADLIATAKGSDILRVHDVKETVQSVTIYNSIK